MLREGLLPYPYFLILPFYQNFRTVPSQIVPF
nr:MAG TPA: hypothetical protein [Caudoviricetes sp.]